MANTLLDGFSELINSPQIGFIKARSVVTNTRKVLMALHRTFGQSGGLKTPALAPIDTKKSKYNVSWRWLGLVLDAIGIMGTFRTYIQQIYPNPQTWVYVPEFLYPPFILKKGTNWGCPLSPSLFNVALEPVARFFENVFFECLSRYLSETETFAYRPVCWLDHLVYVETRNGLPCYIKPYSISASVKIKSLDWLITCEICNTMVLKTVCFMNFPYWQAKRDNHL